ncbi:Tigger transposable element-derived protein [Apis cerana cerana]|uniref:Tigger transposable element-derived protein n=1 Tax=Apis cerana cerana TaxID=94128 RepID=A0A2A3EFS4_APICC|nr:Tigger transposable element-derived protein [Apis cerana cerana]
MTMKRIKEKLFEWACREHAMNNFFDKHMLREKALELTKKYGVNGFRCSDKWLNNFLNDHGFSIDLTNIIFTDYRKWIDLMRSIIIKYRHKDFFHADELTMYSDVFPSEISCNDSKNPNLDNAPRNKIIILMSCNSTGTTKLPLLICGPYPSKITMKEHIYCHNKNSHIGNELFRNWLSNVNDYMIKCNRKILLFLQRNRMRALKDFVASNIQLVYFPEDFPSFLRPLRRDVFHYIKMIFRRKYAEQLKDITEWNLHDILTSLIEAWETIPRELIIFSFQRTRFRTDDCFLQINCDCWDSLKMGISFKKFVMFDDNLLDEEVSYEKNNYNLRNRKNIIEIKKNNSNSNLKITKNNENTIQELSNKIIKKYRSMPSEIKNYTDQKLNCPIITNHEKKWNDIKSKKLKKNLIDMNIKQRKSRKRTYNETQFVKKERDENRYMIRQENIKNSFVPKDSNIASSMLRRKKFQKEISQRQKPEVNEIQESRQKVINEALTLLSTTKVNYLNDLIDNINNNTDEETIKSSNNLSQFQLLNNKQNNTETECANKMITNFSTNFLNNFNQPSTSTNNWNVLSQEIAEQIASNEIIKKQVFEISFVNASESQKGNHDKNQNLNLPINKSTLKIMNFSKKKQQNSLDLNNPVDTSETDEPKTKKSRTDHNWYKQFETTFVFGSPDVNYSSGIQQDKKDIIESCIFSIKPSVSPKN